VIHDLMRTTANCSVMGITMGLVMAGSTVVLIKMTIVEWVCLGVRDGWDLRGSIIVPLSCIASATIVGLVGARVDSCSIIADLRSVIAIILRGWLEVTEINVAGLIVTIIDIVRLVIAVVLA